MQEIWNHLLCTVMRCACIISVSIWTVDNFCFIRFGVGGLVLVLTRNFHHLSWVYFPNIWKFLTSWEIAFLQSFFCYFKTRKDFSYIGTYWVQSIGYLKYLALKTKRWKVYIYKKKHNDDKNRNISMGNFFRFFFLHKETIII